MICCIVNLFMVSEKYNELIVIEDDCQKNTNAIGFCSWKYFFFVQEVIKIWMKYFCRSIFFTKWSNCIFSRWLTIFLTANWFNGRFLNFLISSIKFLFCQDGWQFFLLIGLIVIFQDGQEYFSNRFNSRFSRWLTIFRFNGRKGNFQKTL